MIKSNYVPGATALNCTAATTNGVASYITQIIYGSSTLPKYSNGLLEKKYRYNSGCQSVNNPDEAWFFPRGGCILNSDKTSKEWECLGSSGTDITETFYYDPNCQKVKTVYDDIKPNNFCVTSSSHYGEVDSYLYICC